MNYKTGILLGQIIKTSGFEGTVLVRLEKNLIENIPEPESVFLEIEGRPVPFFVSSFENTGAGLLKLSFEGYESHTRVAAFKGCRVFLTTGKAAADDPGFNMLLGFTVFDNSGELVGTVNEIIENPGQVLLALKSPEGKEILVPLHEDLISKTDRKRKSITMILPEGLTEINP